MIYGVLVAGEEYDHDKKSKTKRAEEEQKAVPRENP